MPTIRIDPGGKSTKYADRAGQVGALIGAAAYPLSIVMPAIGQYFGTAFGSIFDKREPEFPIEVDTETNKLSLVTPDYRKSVNTKTRALAPRIEATNEAVRVSLQRAWDTGDAAGVPKRYRDEVAALLSQRELFRTELAPVPTETSGAQYTGDYSMAGIIPPGGFAGFAQMTPASKAAQGFSKLRSMIGGRKRRKKKAKSTKRRAKKASGRRKKAGKLVKGSAAAKAYMAKIRRKRK
jgi:hypothetical protein